MKNGNIFRPGILKGYLKYLRYVLVVWILIGISFSLYSQPQVSQSAEKGSFPLAVHGNPTPVLFSKDDFKGVAIALEKLSVDFENITGTKTELIKDLPENSTPVIIIGTLGKNKLIDLLVNKGKLDVKQISGTWESYTIQLVTKPVGNIPMALVIAGSDKRGTIFGIYELSRLMGVSPWYWWADVPVKKQPDLYIQPNHFFSGEPQVKYRGIFINDEAPALSGWATEKFGGFNHLFYENVFELILRLHGNFLWPAMWGSAFYDDDSLNAKLADDYGVVIGTSHHEPMMRAHDEWRRYGSGPWNYEQNKDKLQQFWSAGIKRMGPNESIITLGMRGDGDMPMAEQSNIALLEKIVGDQRNILKQFPQTKNDPQVWALYKEVQDYYDKGMRVPDDVTLLLCDDNWGNIRRVPAATERNRAGGYGMYYHFDYVGGPRNYKWINTNNIARVWEQMKTAYAYGVNKIWIVNVGDIKPMEFPVSFFLDLAWNPDSMDLSHLNRYAQKWAGEQFGPENGPEIGEIISRYSQLASRRKPELIDTATFSLLNYEEADNAVYELNSLFSEAFQVQKKLSNEYKDAYMQLVLYPIMALNNQTELYIAVAKNHLYARQHRTTANIQALRANELFQNDTVYTLQYNKEIKNGKWNHMMDQTHIGYTYWQQPTKNNLPPLLRVKALQGAVPGIAVQGSEDYWPALKDTLVMPAMDNYSQEKRYFDIYNQGNTSFNFEISSPVPWLITKPGKGSIYNDQHIFITTDWKNVPPGKTIVTVQVKLTDTIIPIKIPLYHYLDSLGSKIGFVESNGVVSMESVHCNRIVSNKQIKWIRVPNIGRTMDGIMVQPVTAEPSIPGGQSPHLEYSFFMHDTGTFHVLCYFSPTLNYTGGKGFCYGLSIDQQDPVINNLHEGENTPDWKYPAYWNNEVSNNIKIKVSSIRIDQPGWHTLKYWMVDPGVVLQKIVIDAGGLKPSYLGPPESFRTGLTE